MQSLKLGNPRRKRKRQRQRYAPLALQSLRRPRLTLHESDPITGSEDTLSNLFYECYQGYTIYSTPEGRCCIHGRGGCLKLRGQFVCLPDVEVAKILIKRLRAEGYTSADSVERYLPEWEFVRLNRWEPQQRPSVSRPVRLIS